MSLKLNLIPVLSANLKLIPIKKVSLYRLLQLEAEQNSRLLHFHDRHAGSIGIFRNFLSRETFRAYKKFAPAWYVCVKK